MAMQIKLIVVVVVVVVSCPEMAATFPLQSLKQLYPNNFRKTAYFQSPFCLFVCLFVCSFVVCC